ncbi:MFS transporter [Paraburkholderia sp. J41]|uniref:spinster family MFS transporter n=1 Tax=Paraburkholderia sp. J41 TaxID=2805433 RepID=UPI002AC33F6E|nr:MFS transporter [Paraburkholderia sp. J41]
MNNPTTIQYETASTTTRSTLGRALYTLVLIAAVYGMSMVDRTIFGLMLQPIKKEFALSDTMLGLIGGIGFALTFALAGLPMSRLADRLSRKWVIAISLAAYSTVTGLTGLAHTVTQLLLARMGLAVGEAGVLPASTSMIADLFPSKSRARAMSALGLSAPMATLLGFVLAGWIAQKYGWRGAFVFMGGVGIVLALIVSATVAEPSRGAFENGIADRRHLRLWPTLRFLSRQRSYLFVIATAVMLAFTTTSLNAWGPSFLVRIYQLGSRELGVYLGVSMGIGGAAGALLGGWLSDLAGSKRARWKLLVPAGAALVQIPAILLFLFGSNLTESLIGIGVCVGLLSSQYGAILAVVSSVVKVTLRAFAVSLMLLFSTIFGTGMGPVCVGFAADHLKADFGPQALRYALCLIILSCVLNAVFALLATLFFDRDMAAAAREDVGSV